MGRALGLHLVGVAEKHKKNGTAGVVLCNACFPLSPRKLRVLPDGLEIRLLEKSGRDRVVILILSFVAEDEANPSERARASPRVAISEIRGITARATSSPPSPPVRSIRPSATASFALPFENAE